MKAAPKNHLWGFSTKMILTVLCPLALGNLTTAQDSIEGTVESSGSYPREAVVNALVSAESLGEDYTDINGYYHIPPLWVPPNMELHPLHGQEIGYGIWNVLGRKVADINNNQNLDNIFNNLSSGFYVLRAEDDKGIIQQKVIVNQSNVIKGEKKYLVEYNNVEAFDNVNNPLKNNNRNINTTYEFYVDDDGVMGEIGEYYDYLDTLDVSGAETKNVRLIPDIETESPYYDTFLALMKDYEKPIDWPDSLDAGITNYGSNYPFSEWGCDYPQRVWLNPEQAQQYCTYPDIYLRMGQAFVDSVNTKVEREGGLITDLFTVVEDSVDANIWLNYTHTGGSFFSFEWENGHLVGGVMFIMNGYANPLPVYRSFCHEGMRALGMEGMSDDPNHILHVPAIVFDYAPIEVEAIINHVLQYNNTYMGKFVEE